MKTIEVLHFHFEYFLTNTKLFRKCLSLGVLFCFYCVIDLFIIFTQNSSIKLVKLFCHYFWKLKELHIFNSENEFFLFFNAKH